MVFVFDTVPGLEDPLASELGRVLAWRLADQDRRRREGGTIAENDDDRWT